MTDSKITIGDLAGFCLDTLIVNPDLEHSVKYFYLKAVDNIEKGEAEDEVCKIAKKNINRFIKKLR